MQAIRDCRDRTAEFFATVETFRKHRAPGPLPAGDASEQALIPVQSAVSAKNPLQAKSEFSQAASEISKSISQVSDKLAQLTKLAKQRTLFNDPASEINRLTYVIKHDLRTIDNDIETLTAMMAAHRGVQVTRHSQANSAQIVANLKSQLAKTTKSFTDVLHVRSQNLKASSSRRHEYGVPGKTQPRKRMAFDFQVADPSAEGGQQQQQQQQALLEDTQQQEDSYLASRAAAVANIESTVVELSQMYQRLVDLVGQQEEVTIRIDENLSQALLHVEGGHRELTEHWQNTSSNTWLIIKIFSILILFAVIFVVFVA